MHGTIGAVGRGENPPSGAIIHFWLKEKPKAKPKLEIIDADGKLVRRWASQPSPSRPRSRRKVPRPRSPPAKSRKPRRRKKNPRRKRGPFGRGKPKLPDKAGLHRVVWDLEYDPARPIKNAKIDSGSPETAPLALPGKYTVRLTVDGHALTAALEVRLDPRVKAPLAELGEQVRLGLAVRDDFNKLSGAVEQLRAIRKQLQDRNVLLKDIEKAKPLLKASTEFLAKLDALEGKMHNPKAQVTYDILAMKGGDSFTPTWAGSTAQSSRATVRPPRACARRPRGWARSWPTGSRTFKR